ncbi:hypothetical protein SISNIDRAFT_457175 [Sistotremastrum niveocremeum HHB9708]|uniref:MYND-type domain-containing protein n=1 Tax=Sistotremastrum niveocremeum HHB9708 TaxID=1314777 RepID=A0A164S5C5_9AGAM|nr:hypothetical protein SISNIDRAFT_457175 [Sistotremastrum niveocremeum HHB9708]
MSHPCAVCGSPSNKRCSGCSKISYCSAECQKEGWTTHVIECANPGRELTTADHLAAFVRMPRPPTNPEAIKDYGFTNTMMHDRQLAEVYDHLIQVLGVTAPKLNRWKNEGQLEEKIRETFEAAPLSRRGRASKFFIERGHRFLNPVLAKRDQAAYKRMRAMENYLLAVPDGLLCLDVPGTVASWPPEKQFIFECWTFFNLKTIPRPHEPAYLRLGYCAGQTEDEFDYIADLYDALSKECYVDELTAAYTSSSIIRLFEEKGLGPRLHRFSRLRDFIQILSRPYNKSFKGTVWELKASLMMRTTLEPEVGKDWGYHNCKDNSDTYQLSFSLSLLTMGDPTNSNLPGDPMGLMKAAAEGRLFDYAYETYELARKGKQLLRRLFVTEPNPYCREELGL